MINQGAHDAQRQGSHRDGRKDQEDQESGKETLGTTMTRAAAAFCVLLTLGTQVPPQSSTAPDRAQTIQAELDRGHYERAELDAEQWYEQVAANGQATSSNVASALDLLVEALLDNGRAADPHIVAFADHSLRLRELVRGVPDRDTAVSLRNRAAIHFFRAEYKLALVLQERARDITAAAVGDDSEELADSLDALARTRIELGEAAQAQADVDRSLRIRERAAERSPIAYARTLALNGILHHKAARYPQASVAFDQALTIWDREAPNHPDKAVTLALQGDTLFAAGRVIDASKVSSEAYSVAKRGFRSGHPAIARVATSFATTLFALGDLAGAHRLYDEALQIAERSLPECHPVLQEAVNGLAVSNRHNGDFETASKLYRRYAATVERCVGRSNVLMGTPLYNEFVLFDEMGSYADAERLVREAIHIWRSNPEPSRLRLAFGLSGYGEFLNAHHRYLEARKAFEEALAIREKALGGDHPTVADTLENLANTLSALGQAASASRMLDQAIAILRRAPAWQPAVIAEALDRRAAFESKQARYEAARTTLSEAISERGRVYGLDHPMVASERAELARVDFALRASTDALDSALRAESSGQTLMRFNVRFLPERRALELAAARPRGLDVALSIVAADASTADRVPDVLDALVRSRGMVLDELAARRRRSSSDAGSTEPGVLSSLTAARARYATVLARTATGDSVDASILDAARIAKEDAEEAAAAQSASTRAEMARSRLGVADVRAALSQNAALVSFVRYERTTFADRDGRRRASQSPAYAAFVTRSDATTLVPLGSAARIEAAIDAWRSEVAHPGGSDTEARYRAAGSRLRRLVWDPVAVRLPGVSRLFVVPDAALNTVSFSALPTSNGGFLIERGPVVHYLASERDVAQSSDDSEPGRGVLAVGGPDFGVASTEEPAGDCSGRPQFGALPASIEEARQVSRLAQMDPTTVLTGRNATKGAVVAAIERRRVVHLATHGFFLNSGCAPTDPNRRGVGGLVGPSPPRRRVENPLLLAGLAFADANRRERGRDPLAAVLTSEEVVSLDLRGTEWVVLSACETGLGDIRSGEGVFGLRRSFQIAGAKTVIMSLWSVEDESTAKWMRALYDARFRQGLATVDAVRSATLRTLSERRRTGQSTHPFYWAAFVAAGDWR